MEDSSVLRDVIVIFTVSVGVVFLFQKLHLPSIAGFLVAGTLVGPYGLNLISDREQVQALAEVGVILLLFTIGLEFSLAQLKSSKSLLLIAGSAQVFGVLLLFMVGGLVFGLSLKAAIFWGMLLSLSSTAIVLKALAERRENDTLHGRSTIGILIFQDLAVVPMMLMTPFLSDQEGVEGMGKILWTLAQSLVLVTAVVIAARYVVPWLLTHIVRSRSRELFLLTVVRFLVHRQHHGNNDCAIRPVFFDLPYLIEIGLQRPIRNQLDVVEADHTSLIAVEGAVARPADIDNRRVFAERLPDRTAPAGLEGAVDVIGFIGRWCRGQPEWIR